MSNEPRSQSFMLIALADVASRRPLSSAARQAIDFVMAGLVPLGF